MATLAVTQPLLDVSKRVGDASLIDGLASQWRALCDEGPCDEPFYRPEWISAYVRAFAPQRPLHLITVSAGSDLRGVLPLVRERTFYGLPARVLRSAANVHSCRFDLVTGSSDRADAIARVWNFLKTSRDWDVCWLTDAPKNGACDELTALAEREGYAVGRVPNIASPFVPMVGVDDASSLPASKHLRQNLRRWSRKASGQYTVDVRRSDDVSSDLEVFYSLEASGWKGRKGTAIAASPDTRAFYDQVARAASDLGYFALYVLRFSDVPVAAHFGLFYKHRYFLPKVGFDEAYGALGPGHLLLEAALRDCITRGITEFEFLGPSMRWKQEWTPHTRDHVDCYIFRKGPYGRLLRAARFQAGERVRHLLHYPAVARIRERLTGK